MRLKSVAIEITNVERFHQHSQKRGDSHPIHCIHQNNHRNTMSSDS